MSAAARLLLSGLWQRGARARALLIVLAIGMGVLGFASVLSAYVILAREVESGYRATAPADATLWVDAPADSGWLDDGLLAALAALPGVDQADARQVVGARIKAGPLAWRSLQLIVPRSFADIAVSRFLPQEGAWPPAAGEILLERDAVQVAKARLGDRVTIRTNAGKEHELRFTGTVHDPGQAQARMENLVYGYVTRETLALLTEEAPPTRVLVTVFGAGPDASVVRTTASRVEAKLAEAGRQVRRTELATGHPHAALMALLQWLLLGFGILVSLLSCCVVLHLFSAQMAGQVRQVGVLHALGARRGQIARVHLAQAALLGAVAVATAWPVSIAGGRALSRWMAAYLNFDLVSTGVPAWMGLVVVALGVLLPVAAAAWPVARGTRGSVRKAMIEHGVGRRVFGAGALERLVAKIGAGRRSRPVVLALRNCLRERRRLGWTLATLAAGGICLLAAFDIRASMIGALDRLFLARRYDLTVTLAKMHPFTAAERAALDTEGVVSLEGWISTQATLALPGAQSRPSVPGHAGGHGGGHLGLHPSGLGGTGAERITVSAHPAATKLFAPDIVAGRGLQPGDVDALVINEKLAATTGVAVGGELTLQMGPLQKAWPVVGIAREPFMPAAGFVPLAWFEQAGHAGMVNTLRMALAKTDAGSVDGINSRLEANLAQAGIHAISSLGTGDSRFAFDQHFVMLYDCLLAIAGIVLLVGGIGLASAMGLALLERRRELGVLRALGASPRAVALLVVTEGCAVAALSCLVATLVAEASSPAAGSLLLRWAFQTSMEPVREPLARVLWLATALLVGAMASLWPAWRASKTSVREALAR